MIARVSSACVRVCAACAAGRPRWSERPLLLHFPSQAEFSRGADNATVLSFLKSWGFSGDLKTLHGAREVATSRACNIVAVSFRLFMLACRGGMGCGWRIGRAPAQRCIACSALVISCLCSCASMCVLSSSPRSIAVITTQLLEAKAPDPNAAAAAGAGGSAKPAPPGGHQQRPPPPAGGGGGAGPSGSAGGGVGARPDGGAGEEDGERPAKRARSGEGPGAGGGGE